MSILDQLPIWAIYLFTVGLVLLVTKTGFRLGLRLQHRDPRFLQGSMPVAEVAGLLGLLGFLLAFSIGIAVPSGEGGPYPVVVIFHGNHQGCPTDEMGVDRWPCDPEVEQPNYRGFEHLVRELAARGYVAMSLNIEDGPRSRTFLEPN